MRVGVAGFGTVGQEVARRIAAGAIPGAVVAGVAARDLDKARANAAKIAPPPPAMTVDRLVQAAEVIAECATAEAAPGIVRAALAAGRTILVVSAAGLADMPDLEDLARQGGGRLRIASGALPGLDSIRCAREGTIASVKLTSRIRPNSLAHEDYVLKQGFDFANRPPAQPVRVFSGTAREAARAFPRHFNVAVALSLAGIGLDRTEIEVWAESGILGAIHKVEVVADDIALTMESRNRPSAGNPRTSRIVAPSVMAALRAMTAPVVAGG